MVNLGKTLVVIGHHKEELDFGRELRRYMILRGCRDIGFYQVINSFTNNGHGTKEQISAASSEICRELQRSQPRITIDVHTGDGAPKWNGIELKTMFEYEKLLPLSEFETEEAFAHQPGKVFVPKNYSKGLPLLSQEKFPYVFLEQYILNPNGSLSVKEIDFTKKTIEKISALYEKK